ncbi:MAM and LDL-receptor class A domain-containing protein 2 [Octopus bimaculoides]|uniref:MAM and LDL-receptor class A domain-containing protein 2 n=1 Tax=Octopus bimaculoides TaxID=37653 RepID=UPI00071C79C6|nr:MAM and LDL-receptor class A domain-containing protein 2 [Octopus bimaculoides]|eukprot:XP_014769779.1 PREDICTED: MAM and LDL-receptor class A domain-containing protein 2-like [Octopus bimaculoides]
MVAVKFFFIILFWELFTELCEGRCPHIRRVPNLKVRYRDSRRYVFFSCKRKFALVGQRYAECHRDTWSKDPPMCVASGCRPMQFNQSVLDVTYTHRGALATFQCKAGYAMEKKENRVFCNRFNWNKLPPKCLKTALESHCDFEEGRCGWLQDHTDEFDWTRHSLDTDTKYTGPSSDHTYGDLREGYYMYMEASTRKIDSKARLLSPLFVETNSTMCFEFWYHMWCQGAREPGFLQMYLRPVSKYLNQSKILFNETGDHGNKWHEVKIQLENITESFQIVIQGVRKKNYQNDIAIDDIRLWRVACNDTSKEWNPSSTNSEKISTFKSASYSITPSSIRPSSSVSPGKPTTSNVENNSGRSEFISKLKEPVSKVSEGVTAPKLGKHTQTSAHDASREAKTATTPTGVNGRMHSRKFTKMSDTSKLSQSSTSPKMSIEIKTIASVTGNGHGSSNTIGEINSAPSQRDSLKEKAKENYTPLAIGITVALLLGVCVIFFIVWLWAWNQDKKRAEAENEEETHPITNAASNTSLQNAL